MTLSESLKKLKPLIGTESKKFEKRLNSIKENYNLKEEIKLIDQFIREGLRELTNDLRSFNNNSSLKVKLTKEKKPLTWACNNLKVVQKASLNFSVGCPLLLDND